MLSNAHTYLIFFIHQRIALFRHLLSTYSTTSPSTSNLPLQPTATTPSLVTRESADVPVDFESYLSLLADATKNRSYAELRSLVREAAMSVLREHIIMQVQTTTITSSSPSTSKSMHMRSSINESKFIPQVDRTSTANNNPSKHVIDGRQGTTMTSAPKEVDVESLKANYSKRMHHHLYVSCCS